MRYQLFGNRTGLRVSELALGAGGFRDDSDDAVVEARRIFDGYVEAGGNFIDTADAYGFGASERLVGQFVKSDRDAFVIASKYTVGADPSGGISRTGNSRKNMVRSVEQSLTRLGVDHLDLYWVHLSDGVTPVEEIARGFDDLVRAGKIAYAGLSDFPAWRISRASTMADLRGWAPIAGVQFEYSLVERTPDRELLPMAQGLGLGTTVWSPLGGGFLTGKYRRGETGRKDTMGFLIHSESGDKNTRILDAVLSIAEETGATPGQVALAWIRQYQPQTPTSPIIILGARTRAQLDDNLGVLDVTLTDEHLRRLTEVSEVELGFPHDFLAGRASSLAGGDADALLPIGHVVA